MKTTKIINIMKKINININKKREDQNVKQK